MKIKREFNSVEIVRNYILKIDTNKTQYPCIFKLDYKLK